MFAKSFQIIFSILAIPLLSIFTACQPNRDHTDTQPLGYRLPTVKVRAEKAELQSLTASEEVVGTVRAKTRATLEAKVSGRIEKFPKKLGDHVRAGEMIAELEASEATARVEQVEASAEQVERDWKRVAALFESNSATRSERDVAESRARSARAALTEARAHLSQLRIVAPFDGVVTKKWAEAGDLASPGKPLVDIENPGALQVEIDIPESSSTRVALNSKLPVIGDHGVDASVVAELSPAFDPTTRTRRAKLALNDGPFAPGQFVRVSIPIGERKAILLPKAAVADRGQLEMIFTLDAQRARMHLVKTRPYTDGRMEILSGLGEGETVIVEGAERLSDGQPVEVN